MTTTNSAIPNGKYPETFYRVSTKAIIRNDEGEVLVVKEKGSSWSLPGGGIDHGESAHEALKRELYEEALITSPFIEKLVDMDTMYVKEKAAWLMWLVFEVKVDNLEYAIGADGDDVAFLQPESLKGSQHRSEQLAYKFIISGK